MGAVAPERTKFVNGGGDIEEFYFRKNPWKVSEFSKVNKIFRFCVICGEERFSTKQWSKKLKYMEGFEAIVCDKKACWDVRIQILKFVPRYHYLIFKVPDLLLIKSATTQEFFETIGEVTTSIPFGKVKHVGKTTIEGEFPEDHREFFEEFEKLPIEERINRVTEIYFDYAKKNGIKLSKRMMEVDDPYLRRLAYYRLRNVWLLAQVKLRNARKASNSIEQSRL